LWENCGASQSVKAIKAGRVRRLSLRFSFAAGKVRGNRENPTPLPEN
jgi:hypothetical protein